MVRWMVERESGGSCRLKTIAAVEDHLTVCGVDGR